MGRHTLNFADLVIQLIYEIRQTGEFEHLRRSTQTRLILDKLLEHPTFQGAEDRRQNRYWDAVKAAADRVKKWPAWKRGDD